MPKHGACNLGSINLSEFVVNPFTEASYFNTEEFVKAVKIAIRALDTVLDENMNNHPLNEQREMAFNYRNVGLGIMGMYDLLVKLGYTYGSKESINTMDEIMDLMFRTAVIASSELAKEKGTYPKYKSCVLSSKIIRNHFTKEELENLEITKYGLRNCSLLSIAPSGTIGTFLNISTGCEAAFSISYKRKTESLNNGQDKYYDVYIGVAQEYINLTNSKTLPKEFITAGEINWRDRIDMQSVLQKHIDTAISSTVNLPNECTVEEIEQLYLYAWEKGLKGVTIYRDGCKRSGILTTESKDSKNNSESSTQSTELNESELKLDCIKPVTREELGSPLPGNSYKKKVACGTLYININHIPDTNDIVEVFVDSGKSGGCAANAACLGRYASAALRAGMKVESVIDATKSVKCAACTNAIGKGIKIDGISCGDVVAKTIKEEYEYLKKLSKENHPLVERKTQTEYVPIKNKCPECGEELTFEGGCNVCKNCGYSKCD